MSDGGQNHEDNEDESIDKTTYSTESPSNNRAVCEARISAAVKATNCLPKNGRRLFTILKERHRICIDNTIRNNQSSRFSVYQRLSSWVDLRGWA